MYHWQVSEVMTPDVVTAAEDASIADIANKLGTRSPRPPERQLLGIVSRSDLLRLYPRADTEIRGDVINQVLRRILWIGTRQVQVDVHAGVITLSGSVGRRTTAAIAAWLAADVPGVVAVVDKIRYEFDDSALARSRVYRTDPLSSEPTRLQFSRGPTG